MRFTPLIAGAALVAAAAGVSPAAPAAAAATRYEAETSPAVCTGSIDSDHSGFSGSGFCNGANEVGAYAQFTVNASAAGTATLGVRFANGATTTRPAQLIVNGSTVQTPLFEGTGAWNTWATKTLTVSVNAGSNTIRLNPTTSNGLPNVDYLDVEVGGGTPPPPPPPEDEPVGYASMNGGTTGGFGHAVVHEFVLSEYWRANGYSNPGDAMYDLLNQHQDRSGEGLVIYVDETISASDFSHSKMDVKDVENVSILGVGARGEFNGAGISIARAHNIVVRNLRIHHVDTGEKDGIGVQSASTNIWIDHNEIYNEYPDVDKDHYDGLVDIKRGAKYVTVSWNYLHDSWKTMLTASSDSSGANGDYLTYLNNWFQNVNSRVPLIRRSHVHMLNNFFEDIAASAINCRMGAQVLVEGNYFLRTGSGNVDGHAGQIEGPVGWWYGSSETGYWNLVNNAYEDTPHEHLRSTTNFTVPYDYNPLSPQEARSQVTQHAGVGKLTA